MKKLMPAVLLASGSGSNLQSIIDLAAEGRLDVNLRLVLSNNPEAFALQRAEKAGIKTWVQTHKNYASREDFDRELIKAISEAGIKSNTDENGNANHTASSLNRASNQASEAGCVILAGYMRILSESFIKAYSGRILNLHPAILPSFAGAHGGADAIAYGVKISGCTVHFVDEIMDHGPIIIQAAVPHQAGEELPQLMQRISTLEHKIFPQALQWLAEDRLKLKGRIVHLLPQKNAEQALASQSQDANAPWLVAPGLEHF